MSKGNIMHYFPAADKMIASVLVGVSLKMNKELTLMIRGVLELLSFFFLLRMDKK